MKERVIRRDRYVEQLVARMHNGLVKIVTGIRRCGKSYLIFRLFRDYLLKHGVDRRHVVGIDLDDQEFADCRDPNRLFETIVLRLPRDGKWTYVLIDEIQMCRRVRPQGVRLSDIAAEDRADAYVTFYDVLNSLMKKPKVDVYVTGSNSRMLSTDVATNFRDRGFEIPLYPLTFSEFLPVSGMEKGEAIDWYMTWGGMPMAVLEKDDAVRSRYLKELFTKVYLNDIRERHQLKDDLIASRVIDALCSAVGSLTNPHKLVLTLDSQGYAKTTDRTLKKYLDYFEDSFLFRRAERYDVRGKKYLAYPQKYYATDVGLRNARLNFRETDEAHLMENVIFNELIARGCNVDVGVVEIQRRGKDGKVRMSQHEIDFIVNFGTRKVYVQSAFRIADDEKREQEVASFRATGDFFRKILVVSGYKQPMQDEEGVVVVGLIPFLLDESILGTPLETSRSWRRSSPR